MGRQRDLTYREKERLVMYILGMTAIGIGVIYLFLNKYADLQLTNMMPPCLFHKMTGYYCPGCGGTRAVQLLFKGQLVRSFWYHPVVLYTGVFYGWFLISTTIEYLSKGRWKVGMRYHNWYIAVGLTLLFLHFVLKNGAVLFGYNPLI